MRRKRIRASVERSSTVTGEAGIPAIFTRDAPGKHDIRQSMNSAGGRRHDNARCESMRARMKPELPHERYDMEEMTTDKLRTIIRRHFISCRNNRRICSANGGLSPMVKRQRYCDSLKEAAQGTKSLRRVSADFDKITALPGWSLSGIFVHVIHATHTL